MMSLMSFSLSSRDAAQTVRKRVGTERRGCAVEREKKKICVSVEWRVIEMEERKRYEFIDIIQSLLP